MVRRHVLENIITEGHVHDPDPSVQTCRDMVMALPGQVIRTKMTFDNPGRYV